MANRSGASLLSRLNIWQLLFRLSAIPREMFGTARYYWSALPVRFADQSSAEFSAAGLVGQSRGYRSPFARPKRIKKAGAVVLLFRG